MDKHQKIFKLASILLQYPEREWIEDEGLEWEISHLKEKEVQKLFRQFLDYIIKNEIEQLCEIYVNTFDFSDKTTMYLTYNRFGDQKERGQAFLKLKEEYRNAGFPLMDDELPDYLPLVLEFASIAPQEYAKKMFMIHKQSIDQLAEDLKAVNNPYSLVMSGCVMGIDSFLKEKRGIVTHNDRREIDGLA
jgi:nitrate reductase molybdenum cofactor assembly chaperone NarJ/NarW